MSIAIFSHQESIKQSSLLSNHICSEHFIAGKAPDKISETLPDSFLENFLTKVDSASKKIIFKFLQIVDTRAIFRNELGCYLGDDDSWKNDIAVRPENVEINATELATNIIFEVNSLLDRELRQGTGTAMLVWYDGTLIGEQYAGNSNEDVKVSGQELGYIISFLLHQFLLQDKQLSLQETSLFPEWNIDDRKDISVRDIYDPSYNLEFINAKSLIGASYRHSRHRYGSLEPLLPFIQPTDNKEERKVFSQVKADLLATYLSKHFLDNNYSIKNFIDVKFSQPLQLPSFDFQVEKNGNWLPDLTYATPRNWMKLAGLLIQNNQAFLEQSQGFNYSPEEDKSNFFKGRNLLVELEETNLVDTDSNSELQNAWIFHGSYGQIMALSKTSDLIVIKFSDKLHSETSDKLFVYTFKQIESLLHSVAKN